MDGAIDPNTLWILTGPTASGKTALSLEIAARFPVEIVNLDSMQVYRGMDIGTSKASREIRSRVPHHLIDVLEPSESGHIAWWIGEANRAIIDIQKRGRIALLVGGTMLYLKSFLRGMDSGPPPDEAFRSAMEERARVEGAAVLHQELSRIDIAAALRIPPGDVRRVIRAFEILKFNSAGAQGTSHWQTPAKRPTHGLWIGLDIPRDELRRRIAETVQKMIREGWLEEVRGLSAADLPWSREAGQAIGYTLLREYLATGGNQEPVIERIIQGTCQFAKRQQTWLRSISELQLLPWEQARDLFLGTTGFPTLQVDQSSL